MRDVQHFPFPHQGEGQEMRECDSGFRRDDGYGVRL
jgi:hypothetical protein